MSARFPPTNVKKVFVPLLIEMALLDDKLATTPTHKRRHIKIDGVAGDRTRHKSTASFCTARCDMSAE
jgi:hypothetical protein